MFQQVPQVFERVIPFAIFLACNAVGIIISKVVFSRLAILLEKIAGIYYEVIVKALKGMPAIWGLIIGSYGAIHIIDFTGYWLHILDGLFIIMGMFSVTVITARMFSGIVKNYLWKAEGVLPSASILANLVVVSIYIVGALILLQTFGISVAPILTALGVGGLAVALALQDTLSNLFSGLNILLAKQIKVGDYIKLSTGEEGNIADISWRNTTIQVMSNNMIIVPNQKIASSIITNYYMPERELSIVVGASVSYDSDLERVEKVTIEVARLVMQEIEVGIENFDPVVRFHTFGDSSINFNVVLRVQEFGDQFLLKHEFIKRLHLRYQQEGIEIPFPVRRIYTKEDK